MGEFSFNHKCIRTAKLVYLDLFIRKFKILEIIKSIKPQENVTPREKLILDTKLTIFTLILSWLLFYCLLSSSSIVTKIVFVCPLWTIKTFWTELKFWTWLRTSSKKQMQPFITKKFSSFRKTRSSESLSISKVDLKKRVLRGPIR